MSEVSQISKKRLLELNCVLGCDVSRYQENIDWSKAKTDGIEFAFLKLTEGTTGSEDAIYNIKNRALEIKKNGIKLGYYHFCRPGNIQNPDDDAKDEVLNILNHLKIMPKNDLPIVLDIEAYSAQNIWTDKINHMNQYISTFISELKKYNIDIILYSYKSFIDINSDHIFGNNYLWIASYLSNVENSLPSIPLGWTNWNIWQFTSKGKVNCYGSDIDLNIMKIDFFQKYKIIN
jgi:lysozyme